MHRSIPRPSARAALAAALAFGALGALGACLDAQVSDDIPPEGLVLPAGSFVPSIYDDPALAAQIDDNDNVFGLVPRVSAFAAGGPVHYWDFGPVTPVAAPLFVLTRDGVPILHPGIADALPGDPTYSPFWAVFSLPVTDAYDGELIPSIAAIEEAQQLGLVESPAPTGRFINSPIVGEGVALDRGNGETSPPVVGFVRGSEVFFFDFTALFGVDHPLDPDGVSAPEAFVLRLRREGGEPLAEPVRGVDISRDGDINDTADILDAALDPALYTPLARLVSVTVPAGFVSIENGEGVSEAKATSDLFDRDMDGQLAPRAGEVVSFSVTDELRNLPIDRSSLVLPAAREAP